MPLLFVRDDLTRMQTDAIGDAAYAKAGAKGLRKR